MSVANAVESKPISERKLAANRENALRSTGPKTDEGKAASRLNSVTHGLTATLPSAIAQSQSELEERKAKWRPELKPEGDFQESLFDQIVVETLRVERCQKTFLALCTQHARRAKVEWDGDRRRDAATLAAGLAKNPRAVAERLAATPHGCDHQARGKGRDVTQVSTSVRSRRPSTNGPCGCKSHATLRTTPSKNWSIRDFPMD